MTKIGISIIPAGIIWVVSSSSKPVDRPGKRKRLKAYALVAATTMPMSATEIEIATLSHSHNRNWVGELGSELNSLMKLSSVASGGMTASEVLSKFPVGRRAIVSARETG